MPARFGLLWADGVEAVTHDPADLSEGFWVVVQTFEGHLTALRMAHHGHDELAARPAPGHRWRGEWRTSLDSAAYRSGSAGDPGAHRGGDGLPGQPLPHPRTRPRVGCPLSGLADRLAVGNPSPYAAVLDFPDLGVEIACASPEGFLERYGDRLVSRPIKGTAPTFEEMLAKDVAENVMIVDLVRHDLSAVCRSGSVTVDRLCGPEEHPGLVHLVSDVSGQLRHGVGWAEILTALSPPGSVSGAPKVTALEAIRDLEPVERAPTAGAIGWIDADRDEARLAVGIPYLLGCHRWPWREGVAIRHGCRHHLGNRTRAASGRRPNSRRGGSSHWHLEGWPHE